MPGIVLERIQILGLLTNEDVACQNRRSLGGPIIVERQDNKTGGVEAGRWIHPKVSRGLRDVGGGTVSDGDEARVKNEETSTQGNQDAQRQAPNLSSTNSLDCWFV